MAEATEEGAAGIADEEIAAPTEQARECAGRRGWPSWMWVLSGPRVSIDVASEKTADDANTAGRRR